MTMRSIFLMIALASLCIALILEAFPSKLPAKPFETGGLVALVASFMVS